ncbi:hypothetical protein [Thiolapillus sp.]|uniref:hypothetical protein n=1 Tax=Thiolapillus sp. TaxID=2017437 RepID=UPI003AF6BA14
MTRTAGAPIGCQRPSRFWGLGCPKIYHEAEDTLDSSDTIGRYMQCPPQCVGRQRHRLHEFPAQQLARCAQGE